MKQFETAEQVGSMPPQQQEEIFRHAEPIFRNVVKAVSRMQGGYGGACGGGMIRRNTGGIRS